jgi:hypothetical protein
MTDSANRPFTCRYPADVYIALRENNPGEVRRKIDRSSQRRQVDPTTGPPPSRSGPALIRAVLMWTPWWGLGHARRKPDRGTRPAAVPAELQPYRSSESGTDSHSPGAVAIGGNAPRIPLRHRGGIRQVDRVRGFICLPEAFCSSRRSRLLLRRRFGNRESEKSGNKQGKC